MAGRRNQSATTSATAVCRGSTGSTPRQYPPLPNFIDGRKDFPGHEDTLAGVVPRHVVGDTQKNGASALGLQRALDLKSYETAWAWLHKLRRAMLRPGRDLLNGRVEDDESYLGGLEEGLRGRLIESKALIVVAAQEDGPGIGRIRMRQIADASAQSLEPFRWGATSPVCLRNHSPRHRVARYSTDRSGIPRQRPSSLS